MGWGREGMGWEGTGWDRAGRDGNQMSLLWSNQHARRNVVEEYSILNKCREGLPHTPFNRSK